MNPKIGIDIGTTGAKALIFDYKGHLAGQGYHEYTCTYAYLVSVQICVFVV